MSKCPLKSCEKPWEEHDGIAKVVHSEKAETERADREGFGYNGGVRCDTRKGPCACGAWH